MGTNDKINILLVDDIPENLISIEAIIEKDDYHIVKASSGEEALKFLLKYDFALILLDVQMPGMDGFSTAKIIKAREKTKNIPILFITANNMESEHIFMGYSVGAIDYILKPVDPLILKAKVERFVDIFKMEQRLIQQTVDLKKRSSELEKANQELFETTLKLKYQETLSNVISETSNDVMIISDVEGDILKINPSVEKIIGYESDELIGRNVRLLFTESYSSNYINKLLATIKQFGHIRGLENKEDIKVTRKDESMFLAEFQFGIKYIHERYIIALTIRDITIQRENEDLIKHMAYHDFLTDLPNRRFLNTQMPKYLKRAKDLNQSLAIMFLDIDQFKYINDSLGHDSGDRLLQEISNRLVDQARESDIVARIGGDEFAFIIPDVNREKALEIADSIIKSFQKPIHVNNYDLYITTSIGLCMFPYDGEEFNELIKNADAALFKAKEQGKNNFFVFHAGMNIQSYRAFMMKNDLRGSIERKELEIQYQPRMDVESGKISSVEALLIWNHPSWGKVLPDEFIPLAEQTGQIIEIGKWFIQSICRQLNEWKNKNIPPIRTAIHLSSQQFLHKDLKRGIENILFETQLNPGLLEFQIDMTSITTNAEVTKDTLRRLLKLGIHISVNGFGTHSPSLYELCGLPFNILKIDKSFVQGLGEKKEIELITSSIITLAKNLNLSIIAEGVETDKQFEFLKTKNANEVTGFLINQPMTVKEFENLMNNAEGNVNNSQNIKLEHNNYDNSETVDPIPQALNKLKSKYGISTREMEVFQLIIDGLTNKEISQELFISEHTVKNHISHIFQKLEVTDRAQAMAMVYQLCIHPG